MDQFIRRRLLLNIEIMDLFVSNIANMQKSRNERWKAKYWVRNCKIFSINSINFFVNFIFWKVIERYG